MLICRCVQTIAEGMYSLAVEPVVPAFREKLETFYNMAIERGWLSRRFNSFVPNVVFVSIVSRTVLLLAIRQ